MRSTMRSFAAIAVVTLSGSSVFGQATLRGMADNRSGNISAFANAPSGDPRESGYNVNPGENDYDPFDFLLNETDVRSGCGATKAQSTLDHFSEFININGQGQCRGFTASSAATGTVTVTSCGAGQTSSAGIGDNINVVIRIENAPPAGVPIRVKGKASASGGATTNVKIIRPSGTNLLNMNSGSVNTVVTLANGDYTISTGISNGFTSRSTVGTTSKNASYSVGFWKECAGDLDGDGLVGPDDLSTLLAAYGVNNDGDIDRDGVTGISDLSTLLSRYGTTCTN